MNQLISIGFGNLVAMNRILCVITPDSAPVKRALQKAKEEGKLLDLTAGRKTRSVLLLDEGIYLLSALQSDTIAGRLNRERGDD